MATASNTSGKVALAPSLSSLGYQVQWNGSNQPITVSKGGQSYSVAPNEYTIGSDNHAYVDPSVLRNITGLQPVRSALEGQGAQVGWNQQTGQVTAANPYTMQSETFTPAANWGGTTYADPSTLAAINKQLQGPAENTAQNIMGQFGQYQQTQENNWNQFAATQQENFQNYYTAQSNQINAYLSNMNQYVSQMSNNGLAIMAAYQQNFANSLATIQQAMQADQQVPASVTLGVQLLQQQTQQNLQYLNEQMNARGIYQSGLAIDMAQKLQTGALDQEESLVAQWMDKQQTDMYNATMQMAQMQASYANNYASLQQNALNAPLQAEMNLAGTALGAEQQLGQQAEQFQTGLAQEGYQTQSQLASQQFNLASSLQQWVVTQQTAAAQAAQKWDLENAKLNLQGLNTQSLISSRDTENQIRELMAQIEAGKAAGGSPSANRDAVIQQYGDAIKSKIDAAWNKGGWNGAIQMVNSQIMPQLAQDTPSLYGAGLTASDIKALTAAVYNMVGGASYDSTTGNWKFNY